MKKHLFSLALLATTATQSSAISISLDYTGATFFDTGTADGITARAAVQKAADDLSAAITSDLNSISALQTFTGTSSGTNLSADARFFYQNPDTAATTFYEGALAANEFKIFVGARSLSGQTLGQGGQGGPSNTNFSGTGGGDLATAVADFAANGTTLFGRGSAVKTTNSSGTIGSESYTIEGGPTVGNLWFDDDGSTVWHLDHTTSVTSGRNDLYSVALHEILHTLGIGSANSWDALISQSGDPSDWTGAEAIAVHGTGIGLIDGAEGHIENGIMSTRLSDGTAQEVVMSPSIVTGTRKELTHLDLAFLRDIGYTTVPEPSTFLFAFTGFGALMLRRKRA